jgi:glycosyltransferase involved in cell wall biosynthesis
VHSENNKGLIHWLNIGIGDAKGKYIARMDADDLSLPTRFEKQVKFLESNPEAGVCGTQLQIIGRDEKVMRPLNDSDLRWWIFKGSPLAHPSVMIRASVLRENKLLFNAQAYVAEDFDLWWRMAYYCQMANLAEVLLYYRMHEQQESTSKTSIQQENHEKSSLEFIKSLDIDEKIFTPHELARLFALEIPASPDTLKFVWKFFSALKRSRKAVAFFGKQEIQKEMNSKMTFFLRNLERYNLKIFNLVFRDGFMALLELAGIKSYSFMAKCILGWKTRIQLK